MTEEEAHKHYCHATFGNSEGSSKCTGSTCMAWRGLPQTGVVTPMLEERPPFTVNDPAAYEALPHAWSVKRLPLEGYCGLAGAPR